MTDIDDLKTILGRLAADTYTNTDLGALRGALQTGQITMAIGERAVAVGGDVTDTVLITGDGNVVHVFKGPDAEAVRKIVQQVLESLTLRALLTYSEFSDRAEQAALTSHQGAIVGREVVLEEVKAHLAGQTRVNVLHGPGGVGKTRLLCALPDIVPDGAYLWYVRTEAKSIERDLTALDRNSQHVIVVDDAHRFAPLHQLREILVNPDLAGKVRLVLATRSVFRDAVTYQLAPLPGDQVNAIEIEPLTNTDIDRLLQNPPYTIFDEGIRHTLVGVAEGNPLIAGIGACLVQRGAPLTGLTRDQVLTRYLDEIIHDLAEAGYDDRYVGYLEVLAALGTLDLSNQALRERIEQVVGISQLEEDRIVARLVEAGLVERYWMTLKIASEVMADHILIRHFFDPKTRRVDYRKQIIEPFIALKPKEILTNLAEAEVKGESSEAGLLLGQKLDELYRIVDSEGNIARLAVLDWVQEVAYLRPDDILATVACIVDGPEQPPETYHDRWWGPHEIRHEMVLSRAVDILSRTIYRGGLRDAITYLHKLASYRPRAGEYAQVREKARKALVEIAEFKPRKPYAVQLTLLEMIPAWLKQDFAGNLGLVLALLQPMLAMELMSSETDPTRPNTVVVRRVILSPVESLRRIREHTLGILYAAYRQASDMSERLKIIQVLDEAVPPYFMPNVQLPTETRAWLQPDCVKTARFLSEVVVLGAELPVLDAVAKWLWRARRFGGCQEDELVHLQQQIQNHSLYQLYRILVGWHRWDEEDSQPDWRAAEQRRQQAIDQYLEALSPATLEQAICDLETIAGQARTAGESGTKWLNVLLRSLGERCPNLARQLVKQTLSGGLILKHHLSFVIAGLCRSDPDVAWAYIESWVAGDDPILWLAIAHSYRFAEWSGLQAHEWDVLRRLVARGSPAVDHEILHLTWQFAPYNSGLAVELLKKLAARGDESILRHVAEVLSWRNETRDGWDVEFADPQDYLDIIQNFERLPSLDYDVEECLDRLGEFAPMQVIDFVERRISSSAERRTKDDRYDAIPFQFSRATESIRSSPAYPDVLRRVRDWMLREDVWFHLETPHVLKEISGGLEDPLYGVLMEWVESDDIKKLKGVASILREFNFGRPFYDLCREIISRTDDEATLGSIAGAIGSTPGVISGPTSNFTRQRLEEVSRWLQDEDFRVRRFARQMAQSLRGRIEREQAEEKFEELSW